MGQDTARELEELEELLADPGWLRFIAFVEAQWGPGAYRQRVQQAIQHQDSHVEVVKVDAEARAVERAVGWPRERVRALRAKTEKTSTVWPRGGPA